MAGTPTPLLLHISCQAQEPLDMATVLDEGLNKPLADEKRVWYRLIHTASGVRVLLVHDRSIGCDAPADDATDSEEVGSNDESGEGHDVAEDDDEEDGDYESDDEPVGASLAVVAVGVAVGSTADMEKDAERRPVAGLAHFCEHMLFMGSRAFPGENEYDAYLSRHGGASNACTHLHHTVYTAEVLPRYLPGALERMASFLSEPLFLADAVDREVRAIHSEFEQARMDDDARLSEVQQTEAPAGHPHRCFAWGNMRSLVEDPAAAGIDVLHELRTFHRRHYHARNMHIVVRTDARALLPQNATCAVTGPDASPAASLDALEQLVRSVLEGVPAAAADAAAMPSAFASPLPELDASSVADLETAVSVDAPGLPAWQLSFSACAAVLPAVSDMRRITISVPAPSVHSAHRTRPHDVVAHLLGHEARGSLLYALKDMGLASELSAGVADGEMENSPLACIFTIAIDVTEEGLRQWPLVAELTFAYIHHALRNGINLGPSLVEHASPSTFTVRPGLFMNRNSEPFLALRKHVSGWTGVYDEVKAICDWFYHFPDRDDAVAVCEDYCNAMCRGVTDAEILSAGKTLHAFDADGVAEFLCRMTPLNARIDIQASADACAPQDLLLPAIVPSTLANRHETNFDVPYWRGIVHPTVTARWLQPQIFPQLAMPRLNPYLPSELHVDRSRFGVEVEPLDATKQPQLLCCARVRTPDSTAHQLAAQLWYTQDNTFRSPRACTFALWSLLSRNALLRDSLVNDALSDASVTAQASLHIAAELWMDAANEDVYYASCAGLHVSVEVSRHGFVLSMSGLAERMPQLCDALRRAWRDVLSIDATGPVQQARFARLRSEARRKLFNSVLQPLDLARSERQSVLRGSVCPSIAAVMERVESLTLPLVQDFFRDTGTGMDVSCAFEMLCVSSQPHDFARACFDALAFPLGHPDRRAISSVIDLTHAEFAALLPRDRVVRLDGSLHQAFASLDAGGAGPKRVSHSVETRVAWHSWLSVADGEDVVRRVPNAVPSDPNTAICVYMQGIEDGKDGMPLRQRVLLELLEAMMHEPVFNSLRSKQQLGYTVGVSAPWDAGVCGLEVYVETSSHTADAVCCAVDKFLLSFRTQLHKCREDPDDSDIDFESHRRAAVSRKLSVCMCASVDACANAQWDEIRLRRWHWSAPRDEAAVLAELTPANVLYVYDRLFVDPAFRRRLTVITYTQSADDADADDAPSAADGARGAAVRAPRGKRVRIGGARPAARRKAAKDRPLELEDVASWQREHGSFRPAVELFAS